jgi:2-oxoglutarate dehydrogenase E2 component (dihydrolipoamide succinyltransferase)
MKEIKVPELAESLTEGTIAEWLKKEGDYIEKGEPIAELETDKVNVEINSEDSGIISEFLFQPGDTVEVGQVIARLDEKGTASASNGNDDKHGTEEKEKKEEKAEKKEVKEETFEETTQQKIESNPDKGKDRKPIASPAARKRARELGIDLNEISYQDPLGRIRTEDVEEYKKQSSVKKEETKQALQPKPTKQDDHRVERIKMSRRRQTIAKRLVEAQQTAAMLTTFNEVDMTAILDLRNRRKDAFLKKNNVKLGFMSFFTKAVIGALKEFPLVNAEIQGNEIILKKFYDIGIAVSTDDGLVVPVVRNADSLSFAGIEREIGRLSEKARNNSLGLDDLTGGTFTITNGGIFGSLNSTPILNTPQVGILGMHKIQKRPVVVDEENDTVEVRPMMHLALSYDHRIIDGKEAVKFLVRVKQLLEDPEDLLLEG